jgi:hypothetical protein
VWCARISEVPIAVKLARPESIAAIFPQRSGLAPDVRTAAGA